MALYKEIHGSTDEGTSHSLTVLFETGEKAGEQYILEADHPKFNRIFELLKQEGSGELSTEDAEASILKILDPFSSLADERITLSDKVSYDGEEVYYRDEPVDNDLAATIQKAVVDGNHKSVRALVAFLEKVYSEATDTARKNLFRWINKRGIVLHTDGSFIAYKGVQRDGNGGFESVFTGNAFVNGKPFTGHIPNSVGDVITMPPSAVEDDEDVHCAPGLHAGTYTYAMNWHRGAMLTVKIDPSDVISVPNDGQGEKIRTSRYTVLDVVEQEYTEATWHEDDEDEEPYDEDDAYYEDELDYDEDGEVDPDAWESVYLANKKATADSRSETVSMAKDALDKADEGVRLSFTYNNKQRLVKVESISERWLNQVDGFVVNEGNPDDEEDVFKSFKLNLMSDVKVLNKISTDDSDSDDDDVDADSTSPAESASEHAKRDSWFAKSYYNHPAQGSTESADEDTQSENSTDDSEPKKEDEFFKFVKDADETVSKWVSNFRESENGKQLNDVLDIGKGYVTKFEKDADDLADKLGSKINSFFDRVEKKDDTEKKNNNDEYFDK